MTLKELVIFCSWCTRQVVQQLKKHGKNPLFMRTDFKKRKHNSSEFHHEYLTTFVRWILRVKYSKTEIGKKQLHPLQLMKSPVKKHKSIFFNRSSSSGCKRTLLVVFHNIHDKGKMSYETIDKSEVTSEDEKMFISLFSDRNSDIGHKRFFTSPMQNDVTCLCYDPFI